MSTDAACCQFRRAISHAACGKDSSGSHYTRQLSNDNGNNNGNNNDNNNNGNGRWGEEHEIYNSIKISFIFFFLRFLSFRLNLKREV